MNHVLVFNFNGFEIGRCITASVKDVHQVLMRPSAPYQRNYSRTKHALKKVAESVTGEECIIPGERPVRCVNVQLPLICISKTKFSLLGIITANGTYMSIIKQK